MLLSISPKCGGLPTSRGKVTTRHKKKVKETIRNNQKWNENAKANKDKDENKYKTIKLKTNRKLKIKIKSRTPAISVAPMVAPHTAHGCAPHKHTLQINE